MGINPPSLVDGPKLGKYKKVKHTLTIVILDKYRELYMHEQEDETRSPHRPHGAVPAPPSPVPAIIAPPSPSIIAPLPPPPIRRPTIAQPHPPPVEPGFSRKQVEKYVFTRIFRDIEILNSVLMNVPDHISALHKMAGILSVEQMHSVVSNCRIFVELLNDIQTRNLFLGVIERYNHYRSNTFIIIDIIKIIYRIRPDTFKNFTFHRHRYGLDDIPHHAHRRFEVIGKPFTNIDHYYNLLQMSKDDPEIRIIIDAINVPLEYRVGEKH
jgi:hypothetical protein